MEQFDLIVIGSGPAGEKAAVGAAYFSKKVALIEKADTYGGGTTLLTLPSKALREMALHSEKVDLTHFSQLKNHLIHLHSKSVHENLLNHSVKIFHGTAAFKDPHHIEITHQNEKTIIYGEKILIAAGVQSFPPSELPIDGKRFHLPESILTISKIPASIVIIGAGVIGCEFASIFAAMGSQVTLIDKRPRILTHFDYEAAQYLIEQMKKNKVNFILDKNIRSVSSPKSPDENIALELDTGEIVEAEMLLSTTQRTIRLGNLKLINAKIEVSPNAFISVNEHFQTNIEHIYAVGDVIGQPSLANAGMEQGRTTVGHMFNLRKLEPYSLFNLPRGIYTIPEMASVGLSESEARERGIQFIVGKAFYADNPRGLIQEMQDGMIKILADKNTQLILGVQIVGESASELIHLGVEFVRKRGHLSDILNFYFNYPALHDLYKEAAYDAVSRIQGKKLKKSMSDE